MQSDRPAVPNPNYPCDHLFVPSCDIRQYIVDSLQDNSPNRDKKHFVHRLKRLNNKSLSVSNEEIALTTLERKAVQALVYHSTSFLLEQMATITTAFMSIRQKKLKGAQEIAEQLQVLLKQLADKDALMNVELLDGLRKLNDKLSKLKLKGFAKEELLRIHELRVWSAGLYINMAHQFLRKDAKLGRGNVGLEKISAMETECSLPVILSILYNVYDLIADQPEMETTKRAIIFAIRVIYENNESQYLLRHNTIRKWDEPEMADYLQKFAPQIVANLQELITQIGKIQITESIKPFAIELSVWLQGLYRHNQNLGSLKNNWIADKSLKVLNKDVIANNYKAMIDVLKEKLLAYKPKKALPVSSPKPQAAFPAPKMTIVNELSKEQVFWKMLADTDHEPDVKLDSLRSAIESEQLSEDQACQLAFLTDEVFRRFNAYIGMKTAVRTAKQHVERARSVIDTIYDISQDDLPRHEQVKRQLIILFDLRNELLGKQSVDLLKQLDIILLSAHTSLRNAEPLQLEQALEYHVDLTDERRFYRILSVNANTPADHVRHLISAIRSFELTEAQRKSLSYLKGRIHSEMNAYLADTYTKPVSSIPLIGPFVRKLVEIPRVNSHIAKRLKDELDLLPDPSKDYCEEKQMLELLIDALPELELQGSTSLLPKIDEMLSNAFKSLLRLVPKKSTARRVTEVKATMFAGKDEATSSPQPAAAASYKPE